MERESGEIKAYREYENEISNERIVEDFQLHKLVEEEDTVKATYHEYETRRWANRLNHLGFQSKEKEYRLSEVTNGTTYINQTWIRKESPIPYRTIQDWQSKENLELNLIKNLQKALKETTNPEISEELKCQLCEAVEDLNHAQTQIMIHKCLEMKMNI